MSTSEALAAWKLFLETTPPNTAVRIQGLAEASQHLQNRWQFDSQQIQPPTCALRARRRV